MCSAICYVHNQQIFITHFTDTGAHLPLIISSRATQLFKWGRRLSEAGNLPLGGSLNREQQERGLYDQYFPKPVKIKAQKFMLQDFSGQYHWFEITPGQWLQGWSLHDKNEQRVYVASFMPPPSTTSFQHWPLLITDYRASSATN